MTEIALTLRRYNWLSIAAVGLGSLQLVIEVLGRFVYYFTEIGLRESGSTIGFSVYLIISGLICRRNFALGKLLLWCYVWGSIIERFSVFVLYFEFCAVDYFIMPLMTTMIIAVLLLSNDQRTTYTTKQLLVVGSIIACIAFMPKIIF